MFPYGQCQMLSLSGCRCLNPARSLSRFCHAVCRFGHAAPPEADGYNTVYTSPPLARSTAVFHKGPNTSPSDPISPNHYKGRFGLEARDVIASFELGFNLGNVVKYVLRAGRKTGSDKATDLRKARQYIDFELETK